MAIFNQTWKKLQAVQAALADIFVKNPAILRAFWVKYPELLTEEGGRRIEDQELRLAKGKIEVC